MTHAVFSSTTAKIFKYELSDVLRSRWVLAYGAFFLVVTDALFRFGGGSSQVLLSLLNVVLILIPLVCTVFGTMYFYNAREFTELMLAQPVQRASLFVGLYAGLALPLAVSYGLGVALPFLWHGVSAGGVGTTLALMVGVGMLLTFVFTALAYLVAVVFQDRVRGLAVAVLAWLVFAIVYDGLVLAVANAFSAYPLEKPMLALSMFNPVDLARIVLLLQFDIAALMGYTGAVFEQFFGSGLGMALSFGALGLWLVVPLLLGRWRFAKKDF
jgi:Cu-processing system permease protein